MRKCDRAQTNHPRVVNNRGQITGIKAQLAKRRCEDFQVKTKFLASSESSLCNHISFMVRREVNMETIRCIDSMRVVPRKMGTLIQKRNDTAKVGFKEKVLDTQHLLKFIFWQKLLFLNI
ncbi:hypothetical protein CEXT_125171 [Caerostris extrusa]|uniref:Uncharacterized protein n=1 Tax=Caerostris extrusa TaxID=172846 RepID=A0AAV4S0G8_CAEEX|nr:hypothetical protein CEXT_125171 [Caerostris extrusa]